MTTLDKTSKVEVVEEAKSDPFDSLWRFFSSTQLAIVLILAVTIASFLGAIIVQVPAVVAADPIEYTRWLTLTRERYGFLTDVYNVLGLFNVFDVFWFKVLLLTLIFSTIICTVNRLPTLWSSVMSPRTKVNESMFRNAPIRASIRMKQMGGAKGNPKPVKDVADAVFGALSGRRYKVFFEGDNNGTHFYADRNGIFKLGTLITHASLVFLMVGAVMGIMFGFADDGAVIPEGKMYDASASGENFLVRVDKFKADFWEDGRPKDYYSDVVVIDGGREVMKQRIRVNDPLEYRGVRFHQSFYGPAPVVEVKDKTGRVAFSDPVPLDRNVGSSNAGWIDLPGTDNAMVVGLLVGNDENRPLAVQLYKGQLAQGRDTIRPGETKTVGDYQVTYNGLLGFTGLRVVKDPGVPIVWLACTLLVVGICVTLYFPRRRIWGRITSQEVMMAGTADRTVNFRPEFDRLVEDVRKA